MKTLRERAKAGYGLTATTIAAGGCADGYFLKSDGTRCDSCGANAIKCTSATVIATCDTGYYKHATSGTCVSCKYLTASSSCEDTNSYILSALTCVAGSAAS